MKILINLVGITGHDSQENYAQCLLKELLPELSGEKVILVASKNFPIHELPSGSWKHIVFPFISNKLIIVFFVQLILPLIVWFNSSDVIYSPTISFPILYARRSFITIHDLGYIRFPNESALVARSYIRGLYLSSIRKSKHIITVSETIKQELILDYQVIPNRIIVAPPSASVPLAVSSQARIDLSSYKPYVLYVGIYRERKNIEYLIKGFAESACVKNHKLVLLGSISSSKERLDPLIKSLKLSDKIIFPGYVSTGEKEAYVREAAVILLPSLYEGFGLPVLEAQAVGVPIIVSDIPVFHEVAHTGAVFVDPLKPSTLGEALCDILQDSDLRERVTKEGRNNISRFSWKESALRIKDTLKAVYDR